MLNDASALVAYRFALAAVAGSSFVWWQAGLTFFMLIIGGLCVGLAVSICMIFLLRMVKNNTTTVNSFILLAPFVTYILAEELGVSGVIAVVVVGFVIASKAKIHFSEAVKKQSDNLWDMIIFLLNGLVFILIGLELKEVISDIQWSSIIIYCLYSLLITVAAISIRSWRIFSHKKQLEKLLADPRQKERRTFTENIRISFQECVIITFSGMRGIVSMAIALGIPLTINGKAFPMRSEIIFITFTVILYTIIGQGLLLPIILRKFNMVKIS